jgi:DNA-binding NarL/FixJ family response regulator
MDTTLPTIETFGKIRIVLADDHPIFRDAVSRMLSFEPDFLVVAQVNDGMDVLDALNRYRPDILLLDLHMPGLSGLDTLEKLGQAKAEARVILLTGSDDRDQLVRALKLGACGIVQKQTATELLIDSIRLVHSGGLWMDSRSTAVIRGRVPSSHVPPPLVTRNGRNLPLLSQREREVLHLVAQGFKNSDLAKKLLISEQTVKNHLHRIFEKWEVTDRLELALHAIDRRIFGTSKNSASEMTKSRPITDESGGGRSDQLRGDRNDTYLAENAAQIVGD